MVPFVALGAETIVRISREGGVAGIPALARPREITLAGCHADERRRIAELIDAAERDLAPDSVTGRGDERFFWIRIWADSRVAPATRELKIPESQASRALAALWRDGPDTRSDGRARE